LLVHHVSLVRVALFPFPEESAALFPLPSVNFHWAARPVVKFAVPAVVMVRATVVVAEVPDEEPVTTILYVPAGLDEEVEMVRAVVHVSVQLGEENVAVTPTGSVDVVKDTVAADPESSVAVILSDADCPSTTEVDDEAADREKANGITVGVVKV